MRHIFLAISAFTLTACGPLLVPMVPRPSVEQQTNIDAMWSNLLSPPARHDRALLLGALMAYDLWSEGVDRADFHSEKFVNGNRVVMDVHYQRETPDEDAFYLSLFDHQGHLLRTERYSRADIEAEGKALTTSQIAASRTATTQPLTAQQEFELLEAEKHWLRIQAATQPAHP